MQRVLLIMPKVFSKGHWSCLGPGCEEKRYATLSYKPNGAWNHVAQEMLDSFKASGHPVFRGTSPSPRGPLKSKGGGKTSTHFVAEPQTAELWLRTTVSVNRLSIFGAVGEWCQELRQRADGHLPQSTERPVSEVSDDPAPQVPSEVVSCLTKGPLSPRAWKNWCGNTMRNLRTSQKIFN